MSLFERFGPEGHDKVSFYLKLLFWTAIILSAIIIGVALGWTDAENDTPTVIGVGSFFAIVARIAQAEWHSRRYMI